MRSLTWQEIGLTAYVLLDVALPILVLLFDLWLRNTGRTMITQYCRQLTWPAIPILLAICLGGIGLTVPPLQ